MDLATISIRVKSTGRRGVPGFKLGILGASTTSISRLTIPYFNKAQSFALQRCRLHLLILYWRLRNQTHDYISHRQHRPRVLSKKDRPKDDVTVFDMQ